MARSGAFFIAGVTLLVTACGNSDSSDEDVPSIRTCDYRAAENHESTCVEWGPGRGTDGLMSACDELGGDWSNEACPAEGRLGCCSFESNGSMRECFYEISSPDPATLCTDLDGGTWTPG